MSVDYVRTIIKYKIFEDLIFVHHMLSAKTAKFTSLENLYEYGTNFLDVFCYFMYVLCIIPCTFSLRNADVPRKLILKLTAAMHM